MRSDKEKEAGACILKQYGQFFKKQYQDHLQMCGSTSLVENKTYLPIKIDMMPREHIPIPELVASDNTIMTKVLGVLSALCVEVSTLKKEAFER